MDDHKTDSPSSQNMSWIAGVLSVGAVVTGILLWLP
jgi:hypothetical protein